MAGLVTAWRCSPLLRKWIFAGFAVVALAGVLTLGFKISVDTAGVSSFVAMGKREHAFDGPNGTVASGVQGFERKTVVRLWISAPGGFGVLGEQSVSNDSDPTYFSERLCTTDIFKASWTQV